MSNETARGPSPGAPGRAAAASEPLVVRLHRALGPLAGAMLLDLVDLATFGPIGLFGGFLLGGAVGWWISSIYGFGPGGRALFALLATVYVGVPFTGLLPLATVVAAVARFRPQLPPLPAGSGTPDGAPDPDAGQG